MRHGQETDLTLSTYEYLNDVETGRVLHSRDIIFDESSRLKISGEQQSNLQCDNEEAKQCLVGFEFDCTPNEVK